MPLAPPKLNPAAGTQSLTQVLGFALALNLLLSFYIAGFLGIGVVNYVGAEFVQYLWMARADTPVPPHLPYPWLASVVLALLPIPLMRQKKWQLASMAVIPFAVLPFAQLYLLYMAATPQFFE